MPDNDGDGGALRKQLEAALAENKRLKVQRFAGSGSFGLVKETDLADLKADQSLDDWEARATQVQESRLAEQRELLKRAGLDEAAVEKALAGEKVTPPAPSPALGRIAALGSIGGGTPPATAESGSVGYGKIKEHFQDQAGSSKK